MRSRASFRVLALASLALALPATWTACEDSEVRSRVHLRRGDTYLEEGKLSEAILEYRNVLQLEPNQPEAHWGLARAYLQEKQFNKAYWELQETVRLAPHNTEASLQLGQFLLYGEESELTQALEHAERVIAANPENPQGWLLRARALERLRRPDDAMTAFEKAVEVAPDDADVLLQLANHVVQQGDRERAESMYRRLGELQPGFGAYAALGGFLARDPERQDEAEEAYRQAIDQSEEGERARAYALLANYYYSRQRFDEAEAVLREGIDAVEEDIDLIFSLARFYHSRGQVEKADAMIAEATKASPGDPRPYLVLSAYRGQQGDLEGALGAAQSALEAAPGDLRARLRKAELMIDLGFRSGSDDRIKEGAGIVRAVLATDPSNPEGLFVSAKLAIAEGRLEDAIGDLRRAIETRSDWAQAHFLLGSALYLSDQLNAARAEVVRALELDANLLDARRVLAQIHARMGEDELAIEIGKRVLERRGDDPKLRILVAQSLVREGKRKEAQEQIEAIPVESRDAEATYALGRLLYLNRDLAGAAEQFRTAYEMDPTRYEILRSIFLLDLDRDQKLEPDTIEMIRSALREQPDDARLTQLSGELALYLGRPEEAGNAFKRAVELDPNDLAAYEQLARFLVATGRPDEVIETYQKALEANPKSGSLHLVVGSLYEAQLRFEEAMAHYEQALRLNPDLAVAKNNLAYLLAETDGDLDRALELAQEAKERLPDNANTADTLGWVLYKKDIPSAAIGYLQEAERGLGAENPQLGIVRHHLALAYEANGQPERARDALVRALRDLEALRAGNEDAREPEWAGEIRAMLDRLGPGEPVAAAQEG